MKCIAETEPNEGKVLVRSSVWGCVGSGLKSLNDVYQHPQKKNQLQYHH